MQKPDKHEYQHTAHKKLSTMSGEEKREADAEKHAEYRVELPVYKHILQKPDHAVGLCSRHGGLFVGTEERPKPELREISQYDTHQRQPAKRVEHHKALFLCGWPAVLAYNGYRHVLLHDALIT